MAQVKYAVTCRNNTFKIADVERLVNEELDNVTQEQWAFCVKHAVLLQENNFVKEIGKDKILEKIKEHTAIIGIIHK